MISRKPYFRAVLYETTFFLKNKKCKQQKVRKKINFGLLSITLYHSNKIIVEKCEISALKYLKINKFLLNNLNVLKEYESDIVYQDGEPAHYSRPV